MTSLNQRSQDLLLRTDLWQIPQTMDSRSSLNFFFSLWPESQINMDKNVVSNYISTSSFWIGLYLFEIRTCIRGTVCRILREDVTKPQQRNVVISINKPGLCKFDLWFHLARGLKIYIYIPYILSFLGRDAVIITKGDPLRNDSGLFLFHMNLIRVI